MRLASLAVVLLMGCTIWRKEKRSAKLEGPIEATVAKVDRKKLGIGAIGGGHVGIIYPELENTSSCELQITKPKKLLLKVPEPCDAGYELASDPEGKRLAYAPPGESWSIVHFGKSDRSFDGLSHPAAGSLDWSKVPRLEGEYIEHLRALIGRETASPFKPVSDMLLDEIIETKGEAELARVLDEASIAPADTDLAAARQGKRALFARGLDRLHGEPRDRLLAALERRLESLTPAADGANQRAALYVDLDLGGQKFLPPLDAAIEARDEAAWTPGMQFVAALILARKPSPTVACRLLTKFLVSRVPPSADPRVGPKADGAVDLWRPDLRVALAALALDKEACPALANVDQALERLRQGNLCTEKAWFCPRGETATRVCTVEEARVPIEKFFKLPLADARKFELDEDDAFVAAMLARKFDPKRQKQLARQLYQHDEKADTTTPPDEHSALMCTSELTARDGDVVVHFDDGKKRYWFTKP